MSDFRAPACPYREHGPSIPAISPALQNRRRRVSGTGYETIVLTYAVGSGSFSTGWTRWTRFAEGMRTKKRRAEPGATRDWTRRFVVWRELFLRYLPPLPPASGGTTGNARGLLGPAWSPPLAWGRGGSSPGALIFWRKRLSPSSRNAETVRHVRTAGPDVMPRRSAAVSWRMPFAMRAQSSMVYWPRTTFAASTSARRRRTSFAFAYTQSTQ